MSKNLSLVLVIVGIIVIAFGAVSHYILKVTIFPHFSVALGVVGLVVAAVGAWGAMSGRQSA